VKCLALANVAELDRKIAEMKTMRNTHLLRWPIVVRATSAPNARSSMSSKRRCIDRRNHDGHSRREELPILPTQAAEVLFT
jgi:hypothetical protein